MSSEPLEPLDRWISKMKHNYKYDNDGRTKRGWRRVNEEWIVSTKENSSYHQKAFHLCMKSWKDADTVIELDGVCKCGKVLPEGARMVALLLEAL